MTAENNSNISDLLEVILMNEWLIAIIVDLKRSDGGRILYPFDERDCYLQNAVSYKSAGTKSGK